MLDADEILDLAKKLEKASKNPYKEQIENLEEAVKVASKAFCGSWLGYHSRIYYENLRPIPAGARFSTEWGFGDRMSNETAGDWVEYQPDVIEEHIYKIAGELDEDEIDAADERVRELIDDAKAKLLSSLSPFRATHQDDKFLQDLIESIEKKEAPTSNQFVEYCKPKGQFFTRDSLAAGGGIVTPVHVHVAADVMAWQAAYKVCADLAKLASRAGAHLRSLEKKNRRTARIGTNVFIGHGRSAVWKDLRDFIRDRVRLPFDEFNRVPVAGMHTTARLAQMLDDAAIAFIILTAEDEQGSGKFHPRMNVIHEAGLFQGRLGLEKAIILLEEGCEEFSNISGLGQIRFPKGDISSVFEEIRRVLEREGLVDAD